MNSSGTTLPSIHSLSLDLPALDNRSAYHGLAPSLYQYHQAQPGFFPQSQPYVAGPAPSSSYHQVPPPGPAPVQAHQPLHPYHHQSYPYVYGGGVAPAVSPVSATSSNGSMVAPAPLQPKALHHDSTRDSSATSLHSSNGSPIHSPYRDIESAPHHALHHASDYNYRHRAMSDPIKPEDQNPHQSHHDDEEIGSSSSGSSHPSPVLESKEVSPHKKNWKPRKKRQCTECKLYFSNLATHKSTHLKPTSRPHICKYCNRGFARPNDLFRHVKCHWKEIGSDKGQFKCPFKNIEARDESEGSTGSNDASEHAPGADDHCCHNTGIFSRCDTYKNHLKAIHFQYPNGTKKDQRTKVPGKCRMCQLDFRNVDDWMNNHIEKNMCPYAINMIKKEL